MDRFSRLHNYLETTLANPAAPDTVSKLQVKLERARPALLDFLDTPAKNQQQRQQLEKGSFTYVATGSSYPAGPALVKDILALSDALELSEEIAASLVAYGINAKPRAGLGRSESGLLVHLDERSSLLLCLQAIWRGALSADERLGASGIQKVFEREVQELTKARSGGEIKGAGNWVEKVIKALDTNQQAIDKLRNSSRSTLPSQSALIPAGQSASASSPFSEETTQLRIYRLEEERRLIGQLLFLVGAGRNLAADSIQLLVRQLQTAPQSDSSAIYVLVALLAALDTSEEAAAEQLYPLFSNKSFLQRMKTDIGSSWTVPHLKAVVQLQWSIFLDTAARYVSDFEGGESVDQLTWQAVDAGVFSFLGRSVLGFKWEENEVAEKWGAIGGEIRPLGGQDSTVDAWFQDYVTEQVEILVIEVITNRISILRKLRNREEDVVSTSHRGGGLRSSRSGNQNDQPRQPRHDLEAFFLLISAIYRNSPDSGLKFWEETSSTSSSSAPDPINSRLSAFLRWGAECRQSGMMRTYYEMLASLASGPRSATYAFEFLSSGDSNSQHQQVSATCSWPALFGALEFYLNNLPDRPIDLGSNVEGMIGEIPPEEIPLLRSFIHLLEQVVLYSDVARATLYDNQRHRPIATLFALTGRSIPIDLKASLIGAIDAFSRPGGSFGVEVARRTWAALEQSQILPTWTQSDGRGLGTSSSGFGMSLRAPEPLAIEGGILTELEEVEAPNKVYPESTAFISLLNTLIHAPLSSPLASTLSPSLSNALQKGRDLDTHTIPDTLGAPNRAPGIDPYIKFVIDDVLLKTGQREYQDPRERWKITDKCLEFVEKTLASFDLGPFLAWAASGGRNSNGSPLNQLTLHPGFDILSRILSGGPLLTTILTIVTAGLDTIENNVAGTPLFTSCMLRSLRIIRRVLQIQAPFLEVFLPALAESSISLTPEKLARLKGQQPIDQSFLYHSEVVVQIAFLVACEQEEEIALLSIQILTLIADSPFFDVQQKFPDQSRTKLNRLVGLLQASPETLRIQEAFVQRLDEDIPESELDSRAVGESNGDEEDSSALRRAVRSSILDLFLANTRTDRSAPNIAHLLLGFDSKGRPEDMDIEDPAAADTKRTSLHVVLELLAQNVSSDETEASISLLARHPTLASKCYHLIHQLCLHPYTSAVLSRYLRNREQFFTSQSSKLPFPVPSASEGPLGTLQYSDNTQILTSSSAVCAILQSQAWLLDSTALELSVLTSGNDARRAQELVAALFEVTPQDPSTMFENDGGVMQTLPRMLEIFHSFDFAWIDSITPIEHRLNLFADLPFESCLTRDSTGCEVYDFAALLALIGAAKRELQNRGMLNSPAQQEEAKLETRAIVETLVVENHRREIQSARYLALKSWRNLLDIVLAKSFRFLPSEGLQALLLDLMTAILPPLAAQEMDAAISDLLSGAAVLLSTKLRDEGVNILYVESGETVQSVSPERLHSILRLVLQAILQPGVSPVVRGNLYTVLLNYIQYSAKVAALSPALAKNLADVDTDSASVASFNDDLLSLDGMSSVGGTRRSGSKKNALESGNLTIFASALDRLLPIICRDAAAGHEVWRTVAFTVLDAIVAVAEEGKATAKVLSILTKQGYLSSFVNAFKDMESELQEALQPDPESLNALYVYEALVSFLIRLSTTRQGAEKLLNAELLIRLADCEYLGARPVADTSAMDFDGFLPATTERHHQLLLPALQLVVGTLVSFGPETTVAARQAHAFIAGQRENLLIALKDCATTQNIALMREAHLIVTLLNVVLPTISDEESTTFSSFGGLHAALVGLSAKICGSQEWIAKVQPTNDLEREEDQTLVLALRDNGTIFTEKVDTLVENLETALLTYQSAATTKRPGSNTFRPVLLPSTRVGENAVAGQNLGSAALFLRDTVQILEDRLADAKTLAEMVENFDSRPLDEIEEVFAFPKDDGSDGGDRRGKILSELQTLQRKYRLQVASSLHLLELCLLLFWRHVAFYLDPERVDSSRPDVGLGLADTLKARNNNQLNISAFDMPTLRENLSYEFRRLSEKLTGLELSQKSVGSSWRQRESFIGVVVRRLIELLLLDRED
ncbi:Nup192p [Sporobolomyces salmoneus]|uniref:Nup192p n=1 Tax=Sporobolomyces salmoneus TaxID=183962 RepID=UPI0031792591